MSPESRPTRARGLKPLPEGAVRSKPRVAPHAGAWIETDGKKLCIFWKKVVAPHAGAWIETVSQARCAHSLRWSRPTRARGLKLGWHLWSYAVPASRPTRARGLKLVVKVLVIMSRVVAPHAGAWIETAADSGARQHIASRPTRARGLKHALKAAFDKARQVAPHAGAWIETREKGSNFGFK